MKILNWPAGARGHGRPHATGARLCFRECAWDRNFLDWIQANLDDIRRQAEATSSIARLQHIDPYVAGKFVYLRFNFSTGDAAGQNMVGKATSRPATGFWSGSRESPASTWNPISPPIRRLRKSTC